MKPHINSVEVHPQLSNDGHPVDDALVGAGSMWPNFLTIVFLLLGSSKLHERTCWIPIRYVGGSFQGICRR